MKSLGRWWQEWRFFVQEVSSPKPTSEIKDPGPFGRSLRQSPCLHTMHDPIVLELDTEATPLVSTSPLPHQTIECCEDDKLSLPLSRWIVPALACALAYALYNVSMPLSTYRGHFSHDSAVVFQQRGGRAVRGHQGGFTALLGDHCIDLRQCLRILQQ